MPLSLEELVATAIENQHESGHIRYTDFSVLHAANLDPVTFNLFNCLEDWRVEKKLSGIFPGCRENLNWLIRRFFVEQAQPRAGDDSPALAVLDYVLLTVRAWNVDEVTPARQNSASIMAHKTTQCPCRVFLGALRQLATTHIAYKCIPFSKAYLNKRSVTKKGKNPHSHVPIFGSKR